MQRPTISCAVIAKNEAHNLNQWHASIKGLFDEVILVDTGSTDDTVEIAKSLGCKVSHFEWIKDFAAARQYAFDQITSDFGFWMDLDDVLLNREAFEAWRNDVMVLADFWMAPYHYASDETGKPVCTFARERAVRMNKGIKWRYFLHEGLYPVPNTVAQSTAAWSIKHMRTAADMVNDRSRNIGVFQHHIEKGQVLDARMTYYYGKELFEANQHKEAVKPLTECLGMPGLEIHDRILAIQYLAFCHMTANEFDKAFGVALEGLKVAPNRAEYFVIMGDAFIKANNYAAAKPFYEAAKGCGLPSMSGHASPIFNHADSYTVYPRNQITRIYANTGDYKSAVKEGMETVERYGNEEAKNMVNECLRLQSLNSIYQNAMPCQDWIFTTPPQTAYTFDPSIYKEKAMGGSETALIEMAGWIRKLRPQGRVIVFNMREKAETFDGVEYLPVTQAMEYLKTHKPAIHVAWRHNFKITDAPTFVWSHDLMTQGVENTGNYVKVLCLTPFHQRYLHGSQGVPMDRIHVTRNGIVPERFMGENVFKVEDKDPNMFVFSSSPDRGLDRAMLVLDKVREKHPDVKLHVAYGIGHLPKWGLQDLHDKLKKMMDDRSDWVIYHDALEQTKLYELFRKSAYCVQPSSFIETSMVSARERLYCGVFQIMRGIGGLVDTLKEPEQAGQCALVYRDCISQEEYQVYIDATLKALDEKAYLRIKDVNPNEWSWEGVARQWVKDLPGMAITV